MDAKRWHAAILGAVALICLAILGWVSTAHAADMSGHSVRTGWVYRMSISACVKKESAIEILDAEKVSHETASKLFDKLADCDNAAFEFRVGKVVHSIYTEQMIYRVVEISVPQAPENKVYWMTSMQVLPAKGPKSDAVQTADKVQQS